MSAARKRKRLPEYEARRRFAVTPEPPPGPSPTAAGRSFVVHKHDATRMHYDLRLEMGGALASWAVPKGPSYDPAKKRLAVETEDHPLEYGQFEGRIPEGEYGAGDSLVWDRGTWETVPPGQAEAQRRKGHLYFELAGEKLRGRWHLVRTRGREGAKPQWLLFKARDPEARPGYDVLAERPESVLSGRAVTRGPTRARVLRAVHPDPERLLERVFPPMLATLVDEPPPDGAAWLCERKYDGFRVLAALSGGRIAMWSRNRLDLAPRFPEVFAALQKIVVGEAVIDGEAVALDGGAASEFQRLQQSGESALFAFDLLWLDGEDLRERPLEERRDLLESVLANPPSALALAERVDGDPARALREAAERGWEGVVAKRRGSHYENRRSRAWLKLKAARGQELAIVGFTPGKKGNPYLGALLLGVREGGRMRFAGKVGTGFSTEQRKRLQRELARDAVDASERPAGAPRLRDATWVAPRLVAEVRFTEWTADGKLRHPSFQRLRPDKSPEECVRERPSPPPVEVKISNAGKLMFPRDRITKQEVVDYYAVVAPAMLRALAGRPLAFQQWQRGVDDEAVFRQGLAAREIQPWMTLAPVRVDGGRVVKHLVADRPEALRWLAQHNALTLHMWSSRVETPSMPDWVVFDLDPADGRGVAQAVEVALALKRLLDQLGLPSVPKTSGQRGLHVFVPLAPGHTFTDAISFAEHIGRAITSVLPQATMERAKSRRRGRLYFDCYQNGQGKTVVAPYSLRAADGAPVSAPLRWSEVNASLDPARFDLRNMPRRLAEVGDLFAAALERGVRLPRFR